MTQAQKSEQSLRAQKKQMDGLLLEARMHLLKCVPEVCQANTDLETCVSEVFILPVESVHACEPGIAFMLT